MHWNYQFLLISVFFSSGREKHQIFTSEKLQVNASGVYAWKNTKMMIIKIDANYFLSIQ